MDLENMRSRINEEISCLEGTLAVGYRNLVSGETLFINENHIFPAASIVKICILLEYLRQKDKGLADPHRIMKVEEKDIVGGAGILFEMHRGIEVTVQDLARLMIVISDNTASNMMLDITGMDEVNAFMKSLGMADTVVGRKFMIDPKAKFSKNFCSIKDMVRLLELLYKGEILSKEGTAEAIAIMSRQQYREKIPLHLPGNIKIAHKTGEITGVRHDCGIVFHEQAPYVIGFLSEEMSDVIQCDRAISKISRWIYDITEESL